MSPHNSPGSSSYLLFPGPLAIQVGSRSLMILSIDDLHADLCLKNDTFFLIFQWGRPMFRALCWVEDGKLL